MESEALFVPAEVSLQEEEQFLLAGLPERQSVKLVSSFLHLLMVPVHSGSCRPLTDVQSNLPAVWHLHVSALFGFLRLNWAHGELLMRQLP